MDRKLDCEFRRQGNENGEHNYELRGAKFGLKLVGEEGFKDMEEEDRVPYGVKFTGIYSLRYVQRGVTTRKTRRNNNAGPSKRVI